MYALCSKLKVQNAAVAELADAQDLKSCGTYTPVPVRFRSAAGLEKRFKFVRQRIWGVFSFYGNIVQCCKAELVSENAHG